MNKYFFSEINWISVKEGGREKIPPEGTRYCPLIQLDNQMNTKAWSIDFICPDFGKTNIIKFKFLVDNAPYEVLKINGIYNIYEGSKRVAQIKIISSSK